MPVNPSPRNRRKPAAPRVPAAPEDVDTSGLGHFVGYAIRRAQLAVFQEFKTWMAEFEVTTAQFSVLLLVRDNPGLNQKTLAGTLGVETPRMVLIVDYLENRGLVTRLASTVDRRARAIFLTTPGRRLLRQLDKRSAEYERRIVERLRGDDKETLLRMLRHLAEPV